MSSFSRAFTCLIAFGLILPLSAQPPQDAPQHSPQQGRPLSEVIRDPSVECELKSNGRDLLAVRITNASDAPITVLLPVGLALCGNDQSQAVVIARSTSLSVPAHANTDGQIPTLALTSANRIFNQTVRPTEGWTQQLSPLLPALEAMKPLAAQLLVLVVFEDLHWSQWQTFLTNPPPASPPGLLPPTDPALGIEVLAKLRALFPNRSFALTSDSDLKVRALRNPLTRAAALEVYQINLPGQEAAPNLGQLLHSQPGDNCPVCKARAKNQAPPGDL